MPLFFRQILGIMLLVVYGTSCGCATLFGSINFKDAPRNSFVKIEILTTEYASTASGVIINHIDNSNTIILTAGHICHSNTVAMRVLDLNENKFDVLGFVRTNEDDLCILKIDGIIDGRPISIANELPEIGDRAYNIAAPMGIHAPNMELMFEGYYQGKIRISSEKNALSVFSITGMGGSSGSPVFNENWEIVGIISRGMPDFQHIMLAVSLERIKVFYDYSLTKQFEIDMIRATSEQNKRMLDFMEKLMVR